MSSCPPITARPLRKPRRSLAFLVAAALLACAPRAARVPTPVALPETFSAAGVGERPEQWWTAFGDPKLDALMAQALRGNFGLRVVWDRLRQVEAIAVKAGAPLWPFLDGSARAGWSSGQGSLPSSASYSLGLAVGYEVDLWGRVRATRDAALLDVFATEQDLQAAALSLSAQVAGTWYRLAEQREQLRLLGEQRAINDQYLEIVTLKFRRGQVAATDVLQQRQLVEQIRGERFLVESAVQVLEHQLAVLLGQAPGEAATASLPAAAALPDLPPRPREGVPADWVRRRPDVRAAEIRVQSADRRVAVAIAEQFPRLGLSIEAGTASSQLKDLFSNWFAGLAANLLAPIFEGGLRRAEVERTRAVLSEGLDSYAARVLASFAEVEDALAQETQQQRYLASLERQRELAQQATAQSLESYTKGATEFVRYLTAQLSLQQLQRAHLRARRDLVLFRIDLYRALAGGWSFEAPPRPGLSGPTFPIEAPAAEPEFVAPVPAANSEDS